MRTTRTKWMFRSALATAALLAAGTASADPDLALHHAPVRLRMRVRLQDKAPVATAAVTKPAAGGEASASVEHTGSGYHPFPTDKRDLEERVIFRVNAGYELGNAPASGDTLRGGAALPPGFSNTRNWVLGDAVLGTRDILLPSLNGYFLANYQFDTSDTLASRAATIAPGDATDQRVAVKAGYAEYGTEDKGDHHLWLRAGRQYRQDGGSMFAYFDGATLGYRTTDVAVSAFGGQRVALYMNSIPGTTFGGTFALDLKKWKNIPAKIGVDYEGLSIGVGTTNAPTLVDSPQPTTDTQLRQLIAATGNIDLGKRAHLDVKVRVVDGGANSGIPLGVSGQGVNAGAGGLQFGRASAHLRVAASNDVLVVADLQQRGAGDLAYDLAAPTAVDVVDIARQAGLGVGLYQPVATTSVGAQVDWRHGNHELLVFGKLNAVEGTAVTADQEGYAEAGAAVAGSPIPNTWVTGQYLFRNYFANTPSTAMGTVQAFGDTSASGLAQLHEAALDGWWRSNSKDHRVRLGAGVFYRVYNLVTPYVTSDNDGRGGGRADAQLWLTQELHVRLAGEIAQSSPTLMREIGTMASVRLALEARW